jgi:hypothetical protein
MDVLEEDSADLVECVFCYLTESKYPEGCSDVRKRTIRRKAKMFSVRDGVLYFKKKKKGQVKRQYVHLCPTLKYVGGKPTFHQE